MSILQERIGEAQVACRAENETIQASADTLGIIGLVPFVCECANPDCADIVRLSFDQYELIRQRPRRFFNVAGHERASVEARAERIVAVVGDLAIVEKIGIAGEVAAGGYPRRG